MKIKVDWADISSSDFALARHIWSEWFTAHPNMSMEQFCKTYFKKYKITVLIEDTRYSGLEFDVTEFQYLMIQMEFSDAKFSTASKVTFQLKL